MDAQAYSTSVTPAEAKLMGLLGQIFADNVVTAEERDSLIVFQADLRPASILRVFARFVEAKWGEAAADGVITENEKLALRRVLEELQLPEVAIPPALRRVLGSP
jgi:hypothetical protein